MNYYRRRVLLLIYYWIYLINGDDESFCLKEGSELGVCINISNQLKYCPSLYQLLKNRNFNELKESICSEDNRRVCCLLSDYNENLNIEPEPNYNNHNNFGLFPLSECGHVFSSDRIIGGNKSFPGELPFVVRIGVKFGNTDDENTQIQYNCGGSLINRRYVLTAAHCFKDKNIKLVEIVLGQTDEKLREECIQTIESDGKIENIACGSPIHSGYDELIIHPEYTNKTGSKNDIALIRLDQDINISSPFTRPICLPFLKEYFIGDILGDSKILRSEYSMVAGWGKTSNVEKVGSSTLQFVRVPIQPHIQCRIEYSTFNVDHSQICAGGVKGHNSCLGDSGGPLYIPGIPGKESKSRTQRIFQLGIVSYGKTKCGRDGEPVVYTRVRNYLKWILDNAH